MTSQPSYTGQVTSLFQTRTTFEVKILDSFHPSDRRNLVWLGSIRDGGASRDCAGLMCPDDARSLAHHLLNAAAVAERSEPNPQTGISGVRQLPTVTLCGRVFILDERLCELRDAEYPWHNFALTEPLPMGPIPL